MIHVHVEVVRNINNAVVNNKYETGENLISCFLCHIQLTKAYIIDKIVLEKSEENIMILYPKGYFKKVSEISLEYLKQNNIKGLILDVDNTLIDYYRNIADDTIEWAKHLSENGIEMYILSNSNKKEKVVEVAKKLSIDKYSYFAKKPFKSGFKKARGILELNESEIAVIGDQIFTDVLGANLMNMYSILVDPIEEKDIFITLIKRPIENAIKRKYTETIQREEKNDKCDGKCVAEKFKINHEVVNSATKNKVDKRDNREEK